MKLNRLKSVVNQILRESSRDSQGYMVDPFYHYTPEYEITIDLKTGVFTPDLGDDDIKVYYKSVINWFHNVLPIEGIPMDILDKAILIINPQGKECIIEAQGRKLISYHKIYDENIIENEKRKKIYFLIRAETQS